MDVRSLDKCKEDEGKLTHYIEVRVGVGGGGAPTDESKMIKYSANKKNACIPCSMTCHKRFIENASDEYFLNNQERLHTKWIQDDTVQNVSPKNQKQSLQCIYLSCYEAAICSITSIPSGQRGANWWFRGIKCVLTVIRNRMRWRRM